MEREVNIADELGKLIYPVKLIDIEIYGGLRFYLSMSQEVHLFDETSDPVEHLIRSIGRNANLTEANSQRNAPADNAEESSPIVEAELDLPKQNRESNTPPRDWSKPRKSLLPPPYDWHFTGLATRLQKKLLLAVGLFVILFGVVYYLAGNWAEDRSTHEAIHREQGAQTPLWSGDLSAKKKEEAQTAQNSLISDYSMKEETDLLERFRLPEMQGIRAGTYMMGSWNGAKDEQPVHEVTVAAFEIARHELTWGEWGQCEAAGVCEDLERPDWINKLNKDESAKHPVVNVSWDDAQVYIGWINSVSIGGYRLPDEREFEYLLRDGSTGEYPWSHAEQCAYTNGADQSYNDSRSTNWGANCNDGFATTAPVGSFPENSFGVYDISGNVWEWAHNCWIENYRLAPSWGSVMSEWGDCSQRTLRGGGWSSKLEGLRSANRDWSRRGDGSTNAGFRLARTL